MSIDWMFKKIFVLFDWIDECQTIQITRSINDNLTRRQFFDWYEQIMTDRMNKICQANKIILSLDDFWVTFK